MSYIRITPENVLDYPAGTRVLFNYGALYPTAEGTIIDWETTQWGTQLIARKDDGSIQTISGISKTGIGTYILNTEKPAVKNTKSPWYKES